MHSTGSSAFARRMAAGVALTAGILFAASACSSSGGGSASASGGGLDTSHPFRVVAIFGTTGPIAAIGQGAAQGFQIAADEINKTGGINGREVQIKVLDTKSDPTQAVTLLQGEMADPPDMIWAGDSSAEALAMVPITTTNEVLTMSNGVNPALNDPAKYPYHVGFWPDPATEASIAGDYFAKNNIKTIAWIGDNAATGDAKLAGITAIAEKAGVKVVDAERYDLSAVDYTAQYQRLLAAHPDAIVADPGGGDPVTKLMNARLTAGGMDTPVIAGSGFSGAQPVKIAPVDSLANCVMPVWSWTVQSGPGPAATKVVTDQLSAGQTAVYPVMTYDGLTAVANAINKNGSSATTGPDYIKAITATDLSGVTAMYSTLQYSDTNHFPSNVDIEYVPCNSVPDDHGFWKTTS